MNHYFYKLMMIPCFALLTQAMTCDLEDYDYERYAINKDGIPEYIWTKTISKDSVYATLNGYGWKWVSGGRINEDGCEEQLNYSGNGRPVDYFFKEDSVFIFKYYQDKNVLVTDTFRYDEKTNLIMSPSISYMQISTISYYGLITIEEVEGIGYCANYYNRMMPHELNAKLLGFTETKE